MDQLFREICYSIRTLARQPGFAIAVVVTLTLGIGANTVIFSVVDAVLLRPLPYPDPHTLVHVERKSNLLDTFRSGGGEGFGRGML